jgi:hypothetical protein
MFRKTSPQRNLFGAGTQIGKEKQERLKRTWAHQYLTRALPLIDEELFAQYFDPANGRPNKSVKLVVSVLILKDLYNLTDEEALEQLEWNTVWHYALDLSPDEAHTCQKTLHNFRAYLLQDDAGAALFESVVRRLVAAAGLSTRRQRLDSTHIVSNIKMLGRLGLFVETIKGFLEKLRKDEPEAASEVPEGLRGRYLDREGYFGDARGSEAAARLEQAALDLYELVRRFSGDKRVDGMESFGLVVRLFDDQCEMPAEEKPERIELKERPASSSLQSPSDPDATYGHKGKGYEAQIAETCGEENEIQVVTAVSVNGANESDQQQVVGMVKQMEQTSGEAPEEVHADAGYGSGENIVAAREMGTELKAPIGSKESEKLVGLVEFEFDEKGERVVMCPGGEAPIRHEEKRGGVRACFDLGRCKRCPLRKECPTKTRLREGVRVLQLGLDEIAVAQRRQEQKTAGFKERHKIRSGIEATNSELKRRHGLGKLRVRGRARVNLAVRMKALALNIKRFVRHFANAASPKVPEVLAVGVVG